MYLQPTSPKNYRRTNGTHPCTYASGQRLFLLFARCNMQQFVHELHTQNTGRRRCKRITVNWRTHKTLHKSGKKVVQSASVCFECPRGQPFNRNYIPTKSHRRRAGLPNLTNRVGLPVTVQRTVDFLLCLHGFWKIWNMVQIAEPCMSQRMTMIDTRFMAYWNKVRSQEIWCGVKVKRYKMDSSKHRLLRTENTDVLFCIGPTKAWSSPKRCFQWYLSSQFISFHHV